jgi:predicted  nucleic acid-binding Zn-ribbon protein
MGATLDALRELQEIELQIVDIRRQLSRKDTLVGGQATKLRGAQAALEAERAELRKAQAEIDELDLDLKSRTAVINKHREQLNSVRTNKEYSAILSQLNNEKAEASRVEARALELMGKLEVRKKAFAEKADQEQAIVARLDELKGEVAHAQRNFADKLAQLEALRSKAAARLAAETLGMFQRLSERYDGEVLAAISRVNPRKHEYLCGGCNMSLSAETANAAMTRDDVITCRNCGRILFIERGA